MGLCAAVFVISCAGLAAVGYLSRRASAASEVAEFAATVATALWSAEDGSYDVSIDRLRSANDRVSCVGLLNASGGVEILRPDTTVCRAVARATLARKGEPTCVESEPAGASDNYCGAVATVTGTQESGARRALIVLKRRTVSAGWLAPACAAAGAVGAFCLAMGAGLLRWHDQRVLQPLRGIWDALDCASGGARFGYAGMRKEINSRGAPAMKQAPGLGACDDGLSLNTGNESAVPAGLDASAVAQRLADAERMLERLRTSVRGVEFREIARHLCRWARDVRQAEHDRERLWEHRAQKFSKQLRRAEDRATRDALTGARNRTFLETDLEAIHSQCRRRSEDLAVVMLDLDNFKAHNDTLGHHAGDELLRVVADLLRACLRGDDHVVRLGGDEFLLLLPGVSHDRAEQIVARIVALFAQHPAGAVSCPRVSLSAGIATSADFPGADGHELIAHADSALYAAKRNGKNRLATKRSRENASFRSAR